MHKQTITNNITREQINIMPQLYRTLNGPF